MAKYGDLIKQARKPENQLSVKPENQIARNEEEPIEAQEEQVNLCVKVPKRLRSHWAAEAKRHDVTMTEVMVEALKTRFGMPN